MYLSVQLAARRLGVSPHTIRRWTAAGFLPCTRTAGGHRRIKQEDIDDLTHLIGGRNHLAARIAREREVETLVQTAITVSSRLDLTELLREVGKQMTSLLECHFCVISDYDRTTRTVAVLADYDNVGNRRPDTMTYTPSQFPVARRALEDHETVVVNVGDPRADAAEVAIMRRDGDKSLLVIPMIYQGEAIGLLEVLDHVRERRFTRQELRLAQALAGQAAVALHNARVFADLKRSDHDVHRLHRGIEVVTAAHTALARPESVPALLQTTADVAAHALGAISCVVSCGGASAGASGLRLPVDGEGASQPRKAQSNTAHVIVSSAPCLDDQVTATVTLPQAAGDGQPELLSLIVTIAADALSALS